MADATLTPTSPTIPSPVHAGETAEAPETTAFSEENGERLQKLIARAGIASRRRAEELILEGRVSVNGHIVRELGAKADLANDNVIVDGTPLREPSPPVVLLLHKPKGYVTTRSDPEGRPTVMDLLPKKYAHLHPIGRLDFDTAGVLLFTNDGELTNVLTHPSHGVKKTYWARIKGKIKRETLQKLARGLMLEDGPTAPCQARIKAETDNNSLIEIVLHEGRNRQVRRMLEAVNHPVRALRRVGFANLDLEGVPPGTVRELLPGEVRQLRKAAVEKPAKPKNRSSKPASRPSKPRLARKIEEIWEE